MKRHYCVSCQRKINEDRMKLVRLPFIVWKLIWVCNVCFSRHSDRAVEVEK